MQFVDHIAQEAVDNPQTSWWYNFGPGTMFYFAAFIQVIAIGFAFALPIDKTDTRRTRRTTSRLSGSGSRGAAETATASFDDNSGEEGDQLREPLLSGDDAAGADENSGSDSAAAISRPSLVRV